jgi:hypothetical protein
MGLRRRPRWAPDAPRPPPYARSGSLRARGPTREEHAIQAWTPTEAPNAMRLVPRSPTHGKEWRGNAQPWGGEEVIWLMAGKDA